MTAPLAHRAPAHRTGLDLVEVELRRAKYGANVLTPPRRDPWWKLWLEKFEDPVIRILIIAAVLAIGVGLVEGKMAEGLGIVAAILLATTLAFFNEYRANREFDILNNVNEEVPIKVIRSGTYTTTPRKDLVVGDIVLLEIGEEVPGDGQILEAVALQVDESRLTGESLPIAKRVGPGESEGLRTTRETTYPLDRVLRGTMVVDGHGVVELTAVGDQTELGKAARAAAEETNEETPLSRQLEQMSKWIGVVGLGMAALTFVVLVVRGSVVGELNLTGPQRVFAVLLGGGALVALIRVWLPIAYDGLELAGRNGEPPAWLRNESLKGWFTTGGLGAALFTIGLAVCYVLGWVPASPSDWLPREVGQELLNYFMVAVTVIVVAVPEGLAMSVTLSLAYSMRKMTAENTLVRRMHACETIGAATVICSDKTGTLTQNEMRVFEARIPALSGGLRTSDPVSDLVIEAIAANSTANLGREGAILRSLGNPTEGALLLWLADQGVDYQAARLSFAIETQWTFSTERKYMATLGESPRVGGPILHLKGAPELLLERCTTWLTPDGLHALRPEDRSQQMTSLKESQSRGMRTLGLAYRPLEKSQQVADIDLLATGLIWLGYMTLADPIRPEVPGAIAACREAGILVKVVTGDSPETAQEIARQIGLWQAADGVAHHISGSEFQALPEEDARKAALQIKVLSRARPMDKLRLVSLLQQQGHVVAVTGDGTNDAPALNHADVGLAMGKTGTAVAKEASDIVLLDDSFGSILNAVMWGRALYKNIQRFILFQLTINVAALGIAFLGPLLGIKFPLTVPQMLWVNLIMDTFAALALATEPATVAVLKRPPRDPRDFIVSRAMAYQIFSVAGVFLLTLIGLLGWSQRDGVVDPYELSVFFTVFVVLQFWNLFNARCLGQNRPAYVGLSQNPAFLMIAGSILLGQILLVQLGGEVFRTVPLSWRDWLVIVAATSPVLLIGEVFRGVSRARQG